MARKRKLSLNNEQHIKLSVIIPVYNVEAYLPKCLDTVVAQNNETIEIICVNDGSTDNSRQIVNKYSQKYPNIRCIDRPNGGLSAARNTGIKEAKGEYLVLIDSDDWIENNILLELYDRAKENNADVLVGNTKWIYPDGRIRQEKKIASEVIPEVIKGVDAFVKLMKMDIYVPMAYNYITKRSFILENNLFFKEGLIYEDELWTPQILTKAKRVLASDIYHYFYYQRENTITNSESTKYKVDCVIYVSDCLRKSFDFSDNQILKDYFWLRSCILYSRAIVMAKQMGIDKVITKITFTDLLIANVSKEICIKCIDFLDYNRFFRRVAKRLVRLFLRN